VGVAEPIKWSPKLDRDLKEIPGCFLSECGYTVASAFVPEQRFTLTRPGESVPFAYTDRKADVNNLVRADIRASSAEGGN
jgi:hypothetical protein